MGRSLHIVHVCRCAEDGIIAGGSLISGSGNGAGDITSVSELFESGASDAPAKEYDDSTTGARSIPAIINSVYTTTGDVQFRNIRYVYNSITFKKFVMRR
jgi:hypothetical protein